MDETGAETAARPLRPAKADEPARFLPGALVAGRYRVVAPLGRGGMGEVYRAEDLKLGQPVALKFLPLALRDDADRRRRLLDELKLARRVAHPAVCRLWDVGDVDGHDFLTMEYVDGEDLASLLRRVGRLPEERAVRVARELSAGLAAVHEQGLLHRDLKPANVMIDGRGRVKLADFGLAAFAEDVTGAEIRSGTPAYMAPEQLEGREATARSDVYALGLVLYELFTGAAAHEARSLEEARRRGGTRPASPSSHVKGLDPAVERVIERCLDPDPAERPASALAVAAALPGGDPLAAALAAGETPSPAMVAAAGRTSGLRPAIVGGCLAAIAAGLALVAVLGQRATPLLDTLDAPPDVLERDARQVVALVGGVPAPADHARGFDWEASPSGRALRFWYRQSPRSLVEGWSPFDGRFSLRNPPPLLPGMAGVELDVGGRLVEYVRVPAADEAAHGAVDVFGPLLAKTGFDANELQPAEPGLLPPVFADARSAWEARRAASAVRIEAAAFRGRPVWLRVSPLAPSGDTTSGALGVMAVVVMGVFLFLARRNLRQDRGDVEGALRMAILAAVVGFGGYGLLFEPRSFRPPALLLAVGRHLLFVVFWASAYLALEPSVRRLWPHALVSWTRLVSGRLRDPLVGQDVLFGTLAGVALAAVDLAAGSASATFPWWPPSQLLGGWRVPGAVVRALGPAIVFAFIMLLSLTLVRRIARRTWIAAVVATIVVMLITIGDLLTPLGALTRLANGVLLVGTLVRRGFLAVVVLFAVDNALASAVMTTRLTAWYGDSAAGAMLATLALAAWGAWASLERRPA